MNNKNTIILIIVLVALGAFSGGYYLGTENTKTHLLGTNPLSGENTKTDSTLPQLQNKQQTNEQNNSTTTPIVNEQQANEQPSTLNDNESASLPENASVMEIIDFLKSLSNSEDADDLSNISKIIEALDEAVKDNPDNMQLLVDYFVESTDDSQIPYYLIGIFQNSELSADTSLFDNIVTRLTSLGTSSANEKLLYFVSSTGMYYENPAIISTIKDIALYSQHDSGNKTYALDLLKPYQLNSDEKRKVVSDLSIALDQAPQEEISYMIENIIRYSDRSERAALVNEYLAVNNNIETRVAILTTMHNGSVTPTNELKEALFAIAQNNADPLSTHARDTLLYVFDIDNNEYKQLGGV